MRSGFFSRAAVIALSVIIATSAFAGGRKKTKATPAPVPSGPSIVGVDANSIMISGQGGNKTLAITQFTEITVNGRRGRATDLKPGMTVSVVLSDPQTASRVTATEKQ